MKLKIVFATIVAMVIGGQSALACTWAPPQESKMVKELQTIAEAAVSSDPLKVDVIVEPVMKSYSVSETNTTGMCPDEIHFSGDYAVRYTVDNGLNTVCNAIITVTKSVPWDNTSVAYDVENLHVARCTR